MVVIMRDIPTDNIHTPASKKALSHISINHLVYIYIIDDKMNAGFKIPFEKMRLMNTIYKNDTLIQMCRSMISSHLFLRGLELRKKDKVIEPSAEIKDSIEEYWLEFCYDLLDSAFTYGIAVVHLKKDEFGRRYPSILKQEFYELHVSCENFEYNYHVLPSSGGKELKDVIVFDTFGYSPLPDGSMTSVVAQCLPRIQFLSAIRKYALDMEHARAFPQHFLETRDTNLQRQEGIDYDFYAEADSTDTNMQFERNKQAVEELEKHQELYNTMKGKGRAATKLEGLVQLPLGKNVIMAPQNAGRQDLVLVTRILQEEVCSVCGVPRAMMIGDRAANQGSSSEGLEELLRHTIMQWQRKIERCLTDLYNIIYIDNIKKNVKLTSKDNIFKVKKRNQIKVYLPIVPSISAQDLTFLYQNGVIGWDPSTKYTLQCVGLPMTDRERSPPTKIEEEPPMKKQKLELNSVI